MSESMDRQFENGLRMCLASLYEREPSLAAICITFGPYEDGTPTTFAVQTTGEDKLQMAANECGSSFPVVIAAANAAAHKSQYGVVPPLSLLWLLVDLPSFEQVIARVMKVAEREVPQYPCPVSDVGDMTLLAETIST